MHSPDQYPGAPAPEFLEVGRQGPLRDRVRLAVDRIEAAIILQTLQENQWNRRRTAEALHISYRSLMYKMKRCDVRNTGPARSREAG